MRVDKWIWAVRMVKSRTLASTMCKAGKVLINSEKTKPSKEIKEGDRVEVQHKNVTKVYEVTGFIEKRTSADLAAQNYIDHSPEPDRFVNPADNNFELPQAVRTKGEGRPTKKDRRAIDEYKKYY
ncbi:RNA-binding S4 domain-containing protein [bacterium]|nr:RNA-binding S4 domain-containing protein [bacterium]NCQ55290.1 RNA-binding S4 domain-containing protein [Candidatus Parcubacteria bacterium]NCS67197.1 RNA-binding S4 domain-containing protein [Candidatus Peregrinibacteria bacterium]NCS96823.1 RNA-binding S4 domain-containing protein [bacterium]